MLVQDTQQGWLPHVQHPQRRAVQSRLGERLVDGRRGVTAAVHTDVHSDDEVP
ncbi:hypothetical protein [Streptomyces sp. NBC_00588]|uniref:hypothetical protein n=1 Tax=Streptomyces sp. NBC_00588 TaxID=2975784 RepID=UPI002E81C679|nr:hypothetical protein [Streptomyces sp. NBC_00588]WUB33851.1 hypothetical protein OHN38_02595 [Streptomyces sp. NBC_00588]